MPIVSSLLLIALTVGLMPAVYGQDVPKEVAANVDRLIAGAYEASAAGLPCKIKTAGKIHMLRWQEVDRCLNNAAAGVDWDGLSAQLQAVRAAGERVSPSEFSAAIESALSAHALSFEKVFLVKDSRALLPLTNSLLKYMPADSLHDLPVTDRAGTVVGTFSGIYTYERTGGLATANLYKLTLFQYTDSSGNVQSSSDKLLLDSFGVAWAQASSQPGFRLNSEKINLKR